MLKELSSVSLSQENLEAARIGNQIYSLISELYPICRSITGTGLRRSLEIIKRQIPLTVHEIPTGTRVFDWTVPKEWNIKDAYLKNSKGERIIDFQKNNLHVVSYSCPIKRTIPLEELRGHLHSLPDHPDWVPYRTSYYNEDWGFCLTHRQLQELNEGEYEVCIDSTLEEGFLTYGECFIPGTTTDEVLISSHICHPSLCNDNLSGVALNTLLARHFLGTSPRYSYRFLFLPVTIGAITWLCRNESQVSRVKHGLVVTLVGDSGNTTYKKSRRGDAEIDKVMTHVLKHSGQDYKIIDFFPYGYDERQFCSPAFNLPVGCLMRTPHGQFPEYHTSADNLEFVRPQSLADSFFKCLSALRIVEGNATYLNLNSRCEPQLGKRGIYRTSSDPRAGIDSNLSVLWVLNFSDGSHSLLDIADRAGLPFECIRQAADVLQRSGLLELKK